MNLIGAMPLLEEPLADFKRRLEQAVRDTSAPVDPDDFPVVALVRFALESKLSAYWKELAMTWAEHLIGPGSDLLPLLDEIIRRRNGPIELKRLARRIRDSFSESRGKK